MNYLFAALGVFGAFLQLLIIFTLVKGTFRKFPVVFAFVLVLFLTTVADASAFLDLRGWPETYLRYYWINNTLRHFSVFAVVISLIRNAMARSSGRGALEIKLILGALVVTGLSFYFATGPIARYMTTVNRNISFASVILNLVLWLTLVRDRRRDHTVLMLSGGLGLNMAGEAIGQSLRSLSRSTIQLGNLIGVLSHLLCLYVWWKTFQRYENTANLPNHARLADPHP